MDRTDTDILIKVAVNYLNTSYLKILVGGQRLEPCAHLGDLGSEVLVLLWVLQEVDKLQDLQLGLLAAGHVLELHLNVILHHLRRRLTHAERPASPATGASSHWSSPQGKKQEADQQQGGNHADEKRAGKVEEGYC